MAVVPLYYPIRKQCVNIRKLISCFIAILLLVCCNKKSGPPAPELSVSGTEELFLGEGGTAEVTVSCNTRWSISNAPAWCMATPSVTEGNGKITFNVQANTSISERAVVIAVTAGSLLREIKVRQLGKVLADSIPPDQTGMRNLSSIDLAKEMKRGWNLGNTLDAIGGETAWGNPRATRQLIDSIKAAGFNAVRIPVAWSKFTDAATYKIDTAFMSRVEEVVNYVLKDNMYAIVNIHWDGGWMQPTYTKQAYVNDRLARMWKQIALRFRDYNDFLLFAGTNEVMVDGDYSTPKPEYYTVQNSFNQTFVTTVRATGGRNTYRHLVVQGFNTNIDHTVNFFKAPTDATPARMMVEVHYYDPYNFTLNADATIVQWGKNATDPAKTETWANEAYADGQFEKMKTNFIDKGYAVILGEYAAQARLSLGSDAANTEHAGYRRYYLNYITQSAAARGLVPFYWDSGFTGDKGSGLFNRSTGAKVYADMITAITGK